MPLSWRSAVWFFGLCCLAAAGLVTHSVSPACLADDPPAGARLDREQLLVYRDADGKAQPVQEVADWAKRRTEIVAGMQQVMGPLPGEEKRTELAVEIEEEVDLGSYVRRKLTYASEPGGRVPAYLLIPQRVLAGGQTAAAVLCLHPTNLEVGPGAIVGAGGKPQQPYGSELAARGFVVLAPWYPRMSGYEPDLEKLGYQSTTMKAIWDNVRGIDLLESLPYVRRGGVGVIGHSLGGHNSVYTAVFEPRIKAVVSSCGLDSYLDYKGGDIRGWGSKYYMPRLMDYRERLGDIPFDFHEMAGALAPRHCLICAPLGDDNFQWQSVDRVARAAAQVYRLHGHPERLRVEHPDCDHDFPVAMREAAYRLFEAALPAR